MTSTLIRLTVDPARTGAAIAPVPRVVSRVDPSRAPDAGAPPGATAVVARPRIQGPVPIAVRPPATPRRAAPAGPPSPPLTPVPLAPASGRTDGLAVAALVTGLLLPPVGAVLGPVALRRLERTGRRGRGYAAAGTVIGGIVTALAVLVVALGLLLGMASHASGATGAPGTAATTQCAGSTCTVTIDGAGTVDIVGAAGREALTVVALSDGSITVRDTNGPVVVPVGTTMVLPAGTRVVLTGASAGTATLAHTR
jgi:hypothetical protein